MLVPGRGGAASLGQKIRDLGEGGRKRGGKDGGVRRKGGNAGRVGWAEQKWGLNGAEKKNGAGKGEEEVGAQGAKVGPGSGPPDGVRS